jgi:hypothetical protein
MYPKDNKAKKIINLGTKRSYYSLENFHFLSLDSSRQTNMAHRIGCE